MSSEILRPGSPAVQPFPWKRVPGYSEPDYSVHRTDESPVERNGASERNEESIRARLETARQQGHREGHAEAAQSAGARVDALLAKLTRAIEEIAALRPKLRREAEEDVVKLSLAIAKRIVVRELSVDPDIILALVKAGLQKLDARDIQQVRANPDDAVRIKSFLQSSSLPSRVEVTPDSSLERGAVVFSTSRGTLDLSASTQLAEIERGFTDLIRRSG